MADIFDVLADGTRRELLATLLERRVHGAPNGELSVSELVERLGLSQPTVSKHLQKLREHGLVSVRTDGQHHLYRLESDPLHEVEEWIGDFVGDAPHNGPAPDDGPVGSAAFAAWSGAEVGESLGRRLANGTHQARAVAAGAGGRITEATGRISEAGEKLTKRLPKIGKRKPEKSP